MTRTITGLVADMVPPADLDDYCWGHLYDHAAERDAHVLLVQTRVIHGLRDRVAATLPFLNSGAYEVVVVENPAFGLDDTVRLDVFQPRPDEEWLATVPETSPRQAPTDRDADDDRRESPWYCPRCQTWVGWKLDACVSEHHPRPRWPLHYEDVDFDYAPLVTWKHRARAKLRGLRAEVVGR